jgi:uncharacterized RmlC-like cupin family protein
MAEQAQILVVTPGDRKPGPSTPGMDRQEAFATDRMWSGVAPTEAGMVSGWHHHGEHETTIYVLTGGLRMEFGPDGSTTVEAGPGDFVYVPKGLCTERVIPPPSGPTSSWCALVGGSPRSTSTGRRKPERALTETGGQVGAAGSVVDDGKLSSRD